MVIKHEKYNNLFGVIFWLHIGLEIIAFSSPFLFSWWLILIAIIILSVQYYVVGGCIMNKWQFGKTEDVTFLYPYCKLIGLSIELEKLKFFMRVILPVIILSIAVIWQIFMGNAPILL